MASENAYVPGRKADPDMVVSRYQELHNLERTGREFGITRERVRQIVNRAGIDTSRILKDKAGEAGAVVQGVRGAGGEQPRAVLCHAPEGKAQTTVSSDQGGPREVRALARTAQEVR